MTKENDEKKNVPSNYISTHMTFKFLHFSIPKVILHQPVVEMTC